MNKESLRKPNIERLITVLKGGIADRVPNFEILIEDRNVTALLGRNAGNTLGASRGAGDDAYVTPPMDPKDYIELCNIIGQDAIGIEALWTPVKYRDDKGDLHIINDGRIKTWEDAEKMVKPNWELDYAPRKRYIEEYVRAVKGTNIGVAFMVGCFFQACYQFICGFNDFLLMIYQDREFAEYMLDVCVEYYVKMVDIAVDAGIDVLYFADDIAFHSGTFVRPDIFKEIWLPRALKIMEPAKAKGLPIMFHSCGNLNGIMDSIITEMGIDCLNPIEPYSMDIFEIKEKYQDKFTISGNVDIAGPLAFGTPEETSKVVRELLERLKPGGKYILTSSHSITNDIPPENYRAMLDTLFEYGVY
ncbi:MAG: uroporphyrinogen decarboxylase family protein [Mahellales bacterium]|jgi:uroporphyrinogen decarboxylase